MAKYVIEHNGAKYQIEADEGADPHALLKQALGDQAPQEEESSLAQDAADIGTAAAGRLGDVVTQNPGAVGAAAATLGGYFGLKKGAEGIGQALARGMGAGAPAAGAPGPSAGPSPSTAGAGTPQQQAASKLATQNLRTQQLHGTLPGNQASHIGGKAWTVNPSGIITPDADMAGEPKGGTARSAPQQAPKGRFAQAAEKAGKGLETVRNAAGKVMGKIPMGQAGKMLAKGLARFVPGVGLVITGADAIEMGMKAYNQLQSGHQGEVPTGGEYVGAATGGHIAHMSGGGVPFGFSMDGGKTWQGNPPSAQPQQTADRWIQNHPEFNAYIAERDRLMNAHDNRMNMLSRTPQAAAMAQREYDANRAQREEAWRRRSQQLKSQWKPGMGYATGGPIKGQVKGMPRNQKPDMPVGMMKAEIGNYRAGGRIL